MRSGFLDRADVYNRLVGAAIETLHCEASGARSSRFGPSSVPWNR
jgi:hypothetical protein